MTIRTDISSVLTQMRELQMQAQAGANGAAAGGDVKATNAIETGGDGPMGINKTDAPSFGKMLGNAVNAVNDQQAQASRLATAYETGAAGVDLTQVMISAQKASVSFQAMTQVRNRLISAYEDVMKMPI